MTAKQISMRLGETKHFVETNDIDFELVIQILFSNKSRRERKDEFYELPYTREQLNHIWRRFVKKYYGKDMHIGKDYLFYRETRSNVCTKDLIY